MATKKTTGQKKSAIPAEEPRLVHERLPHYGRRDQIARRYMWAGVIGFTIIIFGLWGWALKLRFAFFTWRTSQEFNLATKAKTDWDAIYNENKSVQLQDELDKIKIATALNQLVATEIAAAATTTSSTMATSTDATVSTTLPTTTVKTKHRN